LLVPLDKSERTICIISIDISIKIVTVTYYVECILVLIKIYKTNVKKLPDVNISKVTVIYAFIFNILFLF